MLIPPVVSALSATEFFLLTVAILVTCFDMRPLLSVVCCVVFNAVLLSIPVLSYKVLHTSLSFRLSEEEIETWPKRRRDSGITPLCIVKQIHLFPERDLILLRCGLLGSVRVYAPKADFEKVAELIRERGCCTKEAHETTKEAEKFIWNNSAFCCIM